MKVEQFLQLGRVSNLPTVWSNVFAALALCGGSLERALLPALALSLFYIGGMFLNDAFDADFDRQHRPERPIPSGEISRTSVFVWGVGLLATGVFGMVIEVVSHAGGLAGGDSSQLAATLLSSLGLALVIVAYNAWHKNNPLSPLLMGACRVGVYVTAGLAIVGSLPSALLFGALGLLSYLIGLTYAAKQENLRKVGQKWPLLFLVGALVLPWQLALSHGSIALFLPFWLMFSLWLLRSYLFLCPRGTKSPEIPRAVGALIAGIALWDACLAAAMGAVGAALLAVLCFIATLMAHRRIAGT